MPTRELLHGGFVDFDQPRRLRLRVSGTMQTFENRVAPRHLWLAVGIPPGIFWLSVAGIEINLGSEPISPGLLMLLIAAAYLIPLAALVWVLASTAACSVETGRLILHSVFRDRELSLSAITAAPAQTGQSVSIDLHGSRLVLWPAAPAALLSALTDAIPASRRYLLEKQSE